jgi:hypothetical protein
MTETAPEMRSEHLSAAHASCAVCQGPFLKTRAWAKYCSARCRRIGHDAATAAALLAGAQALEDQATRFKLLTVTGMREKADLNLAQAKVLRAIANKGSKA